MPSRPPRSLAPLPEGFHGDRRLQTLVDALAGRIGVFVETGSNVGSTLGYVARRYPGLPCLSCEPFEPACAVAREHACVRAGVEIFPETSQDFLRRLERDHAALFDRPVLAWLDAHDHGFAWPLREEVRFLTSRFARGFLLIDDFRVPHDPRFGFDAYGDEECSFAYVAASIATQVDYRLYYPAYSEHTSLYHPLRGFGLLQFAPRGEELERLDLRLPSICLHADARIDGVDRACPRAAAADLLAAGRAAEAVQCLRAELELAPERSGLWNDLGACLAHLGDGPASLAALAEALRADPDDATARANLRDVHRALHPPAEGRALPLAPGAWGRMARRDPYADLAELIDAPRPVAVDGGANRGATVHKLRTAFPDGTVHAFEPIPALARHLRARFSDDPRVVVHAAALAARDGRLDLRVNASDVTSSALEPAALVRRYHPDATAARERIRVPAVRLASAVAERIDVLKLDLQGYEVEALAGLGDRIAEVRIVLAEVELAPLYEGQPLLADVDALLREAGFRLFHLYDLWSHPDGQMTSGDALFVNERFYA